MTCSPNIVPQSITSLRMMARGTFSITYGSPVRESSSRVAGIRFGYSRLVKACIGEACWHGGLAWMASKSAESYGKSRRSCSPAMTSMASARQNSNGYRGCGLMSTPTTSNPARWYPIAAPPPPQKRSRRRGLMSFPVLPRVGRCGRERYGKRRRRSRSLGSSWRHLPVFDPAMPVPFARTIPGVDARIHGDVWRFAGYVPAVACSARPHVGVPASGFVGKDYLPILALGSVKIRLAPHATGEDMVSGWVGELWPRPIAGSISVPRILDDAKSSAHPAPSVRAAPGSAWTNRPSGGQPGHRASLSVQVAVPSHIETCPGCPQVIQASPSSSKNTLPLVAAMASPPQTGHSSVGGQQQPWLVLTDSQPGQM